MFFNIGNILVYSANVVYHNFDIVKSIKGAVIINAGGGGGRYF